MLKQPLFGRFSVFFANIAIGITYDTPLKRPKPIVLSVWNTIIPQLDNIF